MARGGRPLHAFQDNPVAAILLRVVPFRRRLRKQLSGSRLRLEIVHAAVLVHSRPPTEGEGG